MNPDVILPLLFILVSTLYSSVGLGGGSSYTALMAIFGIDYELIPTISLALNLVVTSVGMAAFWQRGHLNMRLILPFLVTSVPMSYVGGALPLPERVFFWFLLVTLVFVAVRIYLVDSLKLRARLNRRGSFVLSLFLGGLLGFVAGSVGIGGGIYLVPLIILFGMSTAKEAAAAGTVFVWVNSAAGLISRLQRGAFSGGILFPMMGAALLGGLVGSHLGSRRFSPKTVQQLLGIVILLAIFYLLRELI